MGCSNKMENQGPTSWQTTVAIQPRCRCKDFHPVAKGSLRSLGWQVKPRLPENRPCWLFSFAYDVAPEAVNRALGAAGGVQPGLFLPPS
jgi:hypothetical protein